MKTIKGMVSIVLLVMFVPCSGMAGDFDGSKTLLFATQKGFECTPRNGCKEVALEDLNLPSFYIINFKKKEITATPESGIEDVSKIERMETYDGMLLIQGAEDGYEGVEDGVGWTVSIQKDSGKAVLSGSMPEAGFIVFGVCTPK
jgi:hypothetical protein